MYLLDMAPHYSFILSEHQLSSLGLIWLILIAGVVVFELGDRFRPPVRRQKKKKDRNWEGEISPHEEVESQRDPS